MIGHIAVLLYVFQFVLPFKVSIYYETLCPDSKRFIARQLYPQYDKLSKFMDIDFVPYGKATQQYVNGKWTFRCQHGSDECYANKYHACVLKQNVGQDKHVNYVLCTMSARNPASDSSLQDCALQTNIPWEPVKKCFENEGDALLAAYGDRTHSINPSFIPTIVFDDKFNHNLQDKSLHDFVDVVCEKIPENERPSLCEDTPTRKMKKFLRYL